MADDELEKNHAFVRDCVARGEVADFKRIDGYNPEAKPRIGADFVRRLLLGLEPNAKPLMPGVRIRGAHIIGPIDFEDCSGAGGAGLPAIALDDCDIPEPLDLSGATISRFSMANSRFRAVWGIGLRVNGDFDCSNVSPYPNDLEGLPPAFLWLDGCKIDGNLRAEGSILNRSAQVPHALSFEHANIRGSALLRNGFRATGSVWLLSAKIGGGLACSNGHFIHEDAQAIVADNAQVGNDITSGEGFVARGKVSLQAAQIGGDFNCVGGCFYGSDNRALIAENLEVEGDILLRDKFTSLGKVSFSGSKIKRDFVVIESELMATDGWALALRTVEVGGQLNAYNNTISGPVDLAGSRINRLVDDPVTAWGDTRDAVRLDELSYVHLGAMPGAKRPLYLARTALLKRNTLPRFGASVKDLLAFSNQPWRECAAAFQRAGLYQEARRIAREEQREANRHRALWKRPFVWLFAEQGFGYGLSVMRAAMTSLIFWAVGWYGTEVMLSRHALIDADRHPGPARECTEVSAPLYALDIAIPVLDLKHEDECKPGAAPGAKLYEGVPLPYNLGRIGEEIAVWRWLKTLYALFGAAVIGMAILTFTGIFKPRE